MSLSLGIILCGVVVIVVGLRVPANFEEYVMEELAKRQSVSNFIFGLTQLKGLF